MLGKITHWIKATACMMPQSNIGITICILHSKATQYHVGGAFSGVKLIWTYIFQRKIINYGMQTSERISKPPEERCNLPIQLEPRLLGSTPPPQRSCFFMPQEPDSPRRTH
ncbi:uncharacterized protein ACDP82_010102 [Pangshura tecta]